MDDHPLCTKLVHRVALAAPEGQEEECGIKATARVDGVPRCHGHAIDEFLRAIRLEPEREHRYAPLAPKRNLGTDHGR